MDSKSLEVSGSVGSYIAEARDVVQIVFFVTVAIITVLTYLKAKQSLLQPLRTEVFKEQIKILSDVLRLLVGKSENDLRDAWGLQEMLDGNIYFMLDEYARFYFGIKVDWDTRPYGKPRFNGAIISKSSNQVHFLDGHLRTDPPEDMRQKEQAWAEYVHDWIHLPNRWHETDREMLRLIQSPLTPAELASMLEGYRQTAMENVEAIGHTLTECAKEIPEKYPDQATLSKATFYWIYERYQEVPLKPKAEVIIAFARQYFGSDNLIKS